MPRPGGAKGVPDAPLTMTGVVWLSRASGVARQAAVGRQPVRTRSSKANWTWRAIAPGRPIGPPAVLTREQHTA